VTPLTERVFKTTCYLEISTSSTTYSPDKINGIKAAKLYQNKPTTPTGVIVKINLEIPESVLLPEVTVKLGDGIADAIADLKAWTSTTP
jgi:hypothetical protein